MSFYDFRDVTATKKDEQIRAWAVEKSIEMYQGTPAKQDSVVELATKIEKFVKDGS